MTDLATILQRPDLPANAPWAPEDMEPSQQPQISLSQLLTGDMPSARKIIAAWLVEREKRRLAALSATSPKSTPTSLVESVPHTRGATYG